MKDLTIRLKLKHKTEEDSFVTVYPPIFDEKNGINKFPVDDHWEIVSVERCTEVMIPDVFDEEQLAYEGDKITLMSHAPKDYEISFQDGMFGILITGDKDEIIKEFVNTLESAMFSGYELQGYYNQQFTLKYATKKNTDFFIPLAHLNIGGTSDGQQAIVLTKTSD